MYVLRTYLRPLVGLGHPHSQTQDPTTIIVQLNHVLKRESQDLTHRRNGYDNLSNPIIRTLLHSQPVHYAMIQLFSLRI